MRQRLALALFVILASSGCDPGLAVSPLDDEQDAAAALRQSSNCADHRDNDGDGFCDVASGYCVDGARPGDPDCVNKNSAEKSACVPGQEVCDSKDNDCDGAVDEGGVCCEPASCAADACGMIDDGCGNQLDCGPCVDCGDGSCNGAETCASCAKDCCPSPGVVTAFPGAQGGGARSLGGRGGRVIEVTTLADSGTGSLRACITATGPRTCVFRVGGTIELASTLTVSNPYLTVAGQTAPGGGIQISGRNIGQTLILMSTHDVVWRYTRLRKGYNVNGGGEADVIDVHVPGAYNVVIDHNSLQWGQDENLGIWGGPHHLTFSWNILAEPLYPHPTQLLTGASDRATADTMVEIDFHHNLLTNSGHRNPLIKHKSGAWVNGLVYNNCNFATQIGGGVAVNIINNRYKRGPLQLAGGECAGYADANNNLKHAIEVFPGGSVECPSGAPALYVAGNIGFGATDPTSDNWTLVYEIPSEGASEIGPLSTQYRRSTPRPSPVIDIVPDAVSQLDAVMLPTVGASRRLACDGTWVANRDSVDARLVNEYQTTTGPRSRPTVEPGWPTLPGGAPCPDTDHDGMPDEWERAHGLNPSSAADGPLIASDGYTNLEHYLNGI